MAVGRFAGAQALALKLIGKNGEKSTIIRTVDGTPTDPTKPWEPGAATTISNTVDAAWFQYEISRIDGDLVRRGDQEVFVAAKKSDGTLIVEPDPTKDLVVRVDGSRWQVIQVDSIQPNEDRILYRLQCRSQQ